MNISPVDIGSILVAFISAGTAYASKRSADKASMVNTTVSSRLDAEKDAYERARQFDIDTINRQNEEIRDLRNQIAAARERIAVLEHGQPSKLERMLRDRLEENTEPDQEQRSV